MLSLKDLRIPQKGTKFAVHKSVSNIDAEIARNLVDILYRHVLASIQMDRSSVKLNALTRGMIGGVLGRTKDGTKEYVIGMRVEDISALLNDVEKELAKRKR